MAFKFLNERVKLKKKFKRPINDNFQKFYGYTIMSDDVINNLENYDMLILVNTYYDEKDDAIAFIDH